jgi:aspartate/methionine/tyrosine aminotransferase
MKIEPFKLERYFARHEFTAPYLLCCSDCESLAIKNLLELEPDAQDRLADLWLGYTESLGDPALREQIARLYKRLDDRDILVHAGAEEAIFNFMHIALAAGDHIVVHSPYYQSLGEVARSLGARVTRWEADPHQGWRLDLQQLTDCLNERTKVVVINVPHNPTGYLPDLQFVNELSRLSERHGFVVFADEVYRGLEYALEKQLPAFADLNPRAVSLGVMSKTYGLAGLRIGWIATRNAKLYRQMSAFKDYTTICNSAPGEFLATLALRHKAVIVERNLAIIKDNLQQLDQFFGEHTDVFKWYRPQAGPIAFPRYLGTSVETFCHELVKRAGVLLLPGTLFGQGYNCFRIGFGRKNMTQALEQLSLYIQAQNGAHTAAP